MAELRPPANSCNTVALDAIRADLALRLAEYKMPEWLCAVEAIPRNAMGKVDRAAALKLAQSQHTN